MTSYARNRLLRAGRDLLGAIVCGILLSDKVLGLNATDPWWKLSSVAYIYGLQIFFAIDLCFELVGILYWKVWKITLRPGFVAPYRASSLRELWGVHWHQMLRNNFKTLVYAPVRAWSGRYLSQRWSQSLSVLTVFMFSGLMHEYLAQVTFPVYQTGSHFLFFTLGGSFYPGGKCIPYQDDVRMATHTDNDAHIVRSCPAVYSSLVDCWLA